MATTAQFPSATNTFIKNLEASGKLQVDFARNPKSFTVNRYAQFQKVPKIAGLYWKATVEQAGRVLYTDLADRVWADGAEAPIGFDQTESFAYEQFNCIRYVYPFALGQLTIDMAPWPILAQHARISAQAAMTARTQLVVNALTASAASGGDMYSASHVLDVVTGITGNSGGWNESTTARGDIKRSLNYAADLILKDTLSAVNVDDLILVINPTLAREMAESQEIVDYLKHSPDALAQVRGELPGGNVQFGLPGKLWGFKVEVENAVKVTSKKGATKATSYILGTSTPYMLARPGGLESPEGGSTFATIVCFEYQSMEVEQLSDVNNKRTLGRVIDTVQPVVVAPVSGVAFTSAG